MKRLLSLGLLLAFALLATAQVVAPVFVSNKSLAAWTPADTQPTNVIVSGYVLAVTKVGQPAPTITATGDPVDAYVLLVIPVNDPAAVQSSLAPVVGSIPTKDTYSLWIASKSDTGLYSSWVKGSPDFFNGGTSPTPPKSLQIIKK